MVDHHTGRSEVAMIIGRTHQKKYLASGSSTEGAARLVRQD